jgi:hypothetical protein
MPVANDLNLKKHYLYYTNIPQFPRLYYSSFHKASKPIQIQQETANIVRLNKEPKPCNCSIEVKIC